jgi:hypothetical protein
MFTCAARPIRTLMRMVKPKLAPYWAVKTAVWVRKPGPMADVAMSEAAPRRTLPRFRARDFTSRIDEW